MQVALTCAYSILFYFIIRKHRFFREDALPAWAPAGVFLIKCLSGILLGLLYTYYYTNHRDADSFKFFTDSKYIFDSLTSKPYDFFRMITGYDDKSPDLLPYYLQMDSWLNLNPLFNDNKTIVRLNALFRFFSLGHYYVHVIFINFISFTGLFLLYKTFVKYCVGKQTELFILTFLLPSVIFWGSGLLKDGILIFAFGLLVYSYSSMLMKGFKTLRFLAFLSAIGLLSITKVYVILIVLPGLFCWYFTRKMNFKKTVFWFIAAYSFYFIVAFNLYRIDYEYNTAAVLYYKQKNFIEIGNEHSASMIYIRRFESSGPSIMMSAPLAFSNTMFRPFITDVHGNPLILLSALENMLILALIIIALLTFNRKTNGAGGFIMFCLSFVILLFILIGLITPVLGAIVRYKIIALPCLMFVITYYYDRDKLFRLLKISSRNKNHRG